MRRVRRLSALAALAGAFGACSSFTSGEGAPEAPAMSLDAASESEGGAIATDAPFEGDVAAPDACARGDASILRTKLLAYWTFENDTNDQSGNNHTLAATIACPGGLDFGAGKRGFGFSGATGCALTVGPELSFTANDFTVSFWVKRDLPFSGSFRYTMLANNQVVVTAASGTPSTPLNVTLQIGHSIVADNLADTTFDFRAPENLGVWVHIIAFRAGTKLGLRVNGHETTSVGVVGFQSAQAFYVAGDAQGFPWGGGMDEVAIWDRALTSAEMDALYNCGVGAAVP
jgi:hypothetical protein